MKSLSIIKPEQYNNFSISTRVLTHLFLSLVAVYSVSFSINANAAACAPNTTVTVDCEDLRLNGAGVVTVDAGVTVSGTTDVIAAINAGASNALVNAGVIRGNRSDGFHNNASLDTLRNTGTIRSFGPGGQNGIENTSTILNFYNSGVVGGNATGLVNSGAITLLINASGGSIGGGGLGLFNEITGNIDTLTNIGRINHAIGINDISNNGVSSILGMNLTFEMFQL
jgi:hypothetical protein